MTDAKGCPPVFPPVPPHLAPDTLRDADLLDWTFAPATSPGHALTLAASAHAGASEGRGRKRGSAEAAAFRQAIGAILGSALAAWSRGRPISHSRKASAFTAKPVGVRTALAALDALKASGLLHQQMGYPVERFPGVYRGWVTRWWPTETLLALARGHGATAQDQAFRRVGVEAIIPAPMLTGVTLRPLNGEAQSRAPLAALAAAQRDLEALHARVAATGVGGCPQPAFRRCFIGGAGGHGRYYALGGGARAYQRLSEAERLRFLTINGAPVAEVDIRASHLAIMHGVAGAPLPAGDPYAVPGVPREAVKAFIVQTLGSGAPARRWSNDASGLARAEAWPPIGAVRDAVLDHFPMLRDPAGLVPEGFLAGAPRPAVLGHYLTGLEAEAMTTAMRVLWRDNRALALPMHDGLIVPRTAARAAADALRLGYLVFADVEPEVEAAWWEDGRKVTQML
jgi:hypothetical protein